MIGEAESMPFRRCPNCARYYTPDRSTGEFCSAFCAEKYERCGTCGRFFIAGEGIGNLCSEECSKVYALASGEKELYVLTEESA
jgi:hypothetical protein